MKWWMYLIIIGLVVGSVFGVVKLVENWWDNKKQEWIDYGWNGHVKFVQEQTAKAEQETRTKQTEIKKKSRKVKDEIQKDKITGDRPVSYVLCRQLERMRESRGIKSEQRCEGGGK